MRENYLSFISDEDLFDAIDLLYQTYVRSFSDKTLHEMNKNIMDPFKFQFDTLFLNAGNPVETLNSEIFRQSDKSISNAIGVFHQKLLGSIYGFEETPDLACDVKKSDNTIFAEVKNKHNTMNVRSAESVYKELESLAVANPKATCYLVEVISKRSCNDIWELTLNETKKKHPRIRKISADQFYQLASGEEEAFKKLCNVLPQISHNYLVKNNLTGNLSGGGSSKAYHELEKRAADGEMDILNEMFRISFSSYHGFEKKV